MRKIVNIIILLFFIFSSVRSLAQKDALFFKHLTNSNGLSSNRINSIIEDQSGFIWFGTGDGLNLYNGSTFEVFDKQVTCMLLNSKTKNVMVGTLNGLHVFDKNTWRFNPVKINNSSDETLDSMHISIMHYGLKNQLFLSGDYFYVINESLNNFTKYQLPIDENFKKWEITSIIQLKAGSVLLGTKNGVWQLDLKSGIYKKLFYDNDLGIISKLFLDSAQNLWICTYSKGVLFLENANLNKDAIFYTQENGILINNRVIDIVEDEPNIFLIANIEGGLVRFDKNTQKTNHYQPDIHNINSISGKALTTLMKDSHDNIWIGTYNSGVDFIDRHRKGFEHYQINFKDDGLFNNNIRALFQDSKGTIWVGTKEGGGLSKFNRNSGTFIHYKQDKDKPSSLGDDYVFCIEELDANHLMIGTLKNGFEIFNTEKGSFNHNIFNNESSIYNVVYTIHKDKNNKIWVDYGGLFYEFLPKKNTLEKVNGIVRVKCIIDEDDSHIWLGTLETGLFLFNTITKTLVKSPLNATEINALQKDNDGNLWVGTKDGLFFKKAQTNDFTNYNVDDGLANNQVLSLQIDNANNVWASTTNGLSKYDTTKKRFFNYDVNDGLQGNEFERYVSLKTKEGELLFGGRNGFNIFNPNNIFENTTAPRVVINNFSLFNKPVSIGAENSPLDKHISQTKAFTLTHKQSIITFGFVAINYSSPKKNHYAYKLEGFNEDWNYIGNKRDATYTNLPAGNYIFKVKASNSDGLWNDEATSINIKVLQPWWKTTYAFIGYLVIILLLFAIFYYFLYTYLNLKNNLKLEKIEKLNNKELHQAKLQFFTNISHEFRTPLTLIVNPLEKILKSNITDEGLLKHLNLMSSNANRLLRLINQLMDFRKIEKGKMTLKATKYDILDVTKKIAQSFDDQAEASSINYKITGPEQPVFVLLDIEKYDIILHNLLFNAFKFTPNYGNISIEICVSENNNQPQVEVRVQDNGKGISANNLSRIFEEFYQIDQNLKGTGIGLFLTKELVELHKGSIRVESSTEKGSCFILNFLLGSHHLNVSDIYELSPDAPFNFTKHKPDYIISTKKQKTTAGSTTDKAKTIKILLVEDNEELRNYLRDSLENNYTIYEAKDGVEGISQSLKITPDLIISDVMMPNKNGVDMCYEIKNDIRISHIPIILLTARSSFEHKIEGLKTGADAYIEKPFNMELLETQITNLLESRKKLRKRFGNDITINAHEISNSSADDKFMNKAIATVEAHLIDSTFTVEDFIKEMNMSRTGLHLKLKALTNKSTTEFIRSIRLKKAAVYLKETDQTIAEIAYNTGFASPAYFSKSFKKLFSKLPTDYRND